jgi:hypothetical protein
MPFLLLRKLEMIAAMTQVAHAWRAISDEFTR